MRKPNRLKILKTARWGYVLGIGSILVYMRSMWTPDVLFFFFLGFFILFGQGKKFIRDFSPFVVLLVAYDSFRGIADSLHQRVHITEMAHFDTWAGHGTLPTVWLQKLLHHGHLAWYDFYFYGLYTAHFLAPFALAVVIWKYRAKHYWHFVGSLLLLSYTAFLTYVIFPAAPPWMASNMGIIPHIDKLSTDIWFAMGVQNFPTIYSQINPNEVAAVPSLHVAYPVLFALFVGRAFGRKAGLVAAIYPLSMIFGVVYLGEHYLFDALVGGLYAISSFYIVDYALNRWTSRPRSRRAKLIWSAPYALLIFGLLVGKIW